MQTITTIGLDIAKSVFQVLFGPEQPCRRCPFLGVKKHPCIRCTKPPRAKTGDAVAAKTRMANRVLLRGVIRSLSSELLLFVVARRTSKMVLIKSVLTADCGRRDVDGAAPRGATERVHASRMAAATPISYFEPIGALHSVSEADEKRWIWPGWYLATSAASRGRGKRKCAPMRLRCGSRSTPGESTRRPGAARRWL